MKKEDNLREILFHLFMGIISPSSYIFLPAALLWLIVRTPRETTLDQIVFVTIILYFTWMAMRGVLYGYFMRKIFRDRKDIHTRFYDNEN